MAKPITLKPSANGILLPYVWRCLFNGKYTIERLAGNDLLPFKLAMSGKHTGKAYHITRRGEKTAGRRRKNSFSLRLRSEMPLDRWECGYRKLPSKYQSENLARKRRIISFKD
jgi:hypothetical protein